jgi:hypothetical protein
MRQGHIDEAEATFRAVLVVHPDHVDARIGLASALTRRGQWRDALAILLDTATLAGDNGDYYAALARAYRRGGAYDRAFEYYRRAVALSPGDTDLQDSYENVARIYGHGIGVEGFGQQITPGSSIGSGALVGSVRAVPGLHLLGSIRTQSGSGYSDTFGGGGFDWRARPTTNLSIGVSGGPGNVALPEGELSVQVLHYTGPFELGGNVRQIAYAGADVTALSPMLSWEPGGRLRVDVRYTYSRSRFEDTGDSSGDHSIFVRDTFRAARRFWINGSYAYGIESFEDLTVDRLAHLAASTVAGGVRIGFRSLSVVNATWEHQWRPNDSKLDRVTVSFAQFFP